MVLFWLVTLVPPAADDEDAPPKVVPTVQPRHFHGAIGPAIRRPNGRVTITMRADPREVIVEEPLTLTLTVRGVRNAESLQRPDLRDEPAFAKRFHISDLPDEPSQTPGTRTFVYALRPRRDTVTAIPTLEYVYFRPGCEPPEAGFQTTDTGEPIPIRVLPRPEPEPIPLEGPAWLFVLPQPESTVTRWLATWGVSLAWATPWAALFGGYLWWRWQHPDSARQRDRRQSRAGRDALRRLRRGPNTAECVWEVLLSYWRDRFGLPSEAATTEEIASYLSQWGWPAEMSQEVLGLLRDCDAARFGHSSAMSTNWRERAERVVRRGDE